MLLRSPMRKSAPPRRPEPMMARHPRRPYPCERDFMPERCDMPPERPAKLTPCRSPTTGRNLRTETGAGETLPAAASLTCRGKWRGSRSAM